MSDSNIEQSIGVVTPQTAQLNTPLLLQCGQTLPTHELVFETYGELNATGNNAILVCHALSGDHHAAGKHSIDDKKFGWWNSCIGPGKAFIPGPAVYLNQTRWQDEIIPRPEFKPTVEQSALNTARMLAEMDRDGEWLQ